LPSGACGKRSVGREIVFPRAGDKCCDGIHADATRPESGTVRKSMPVWPIGYSVARGLAAYCSFRHHAGRVMRKFLLATVVLLAFAGPAITADMRAPVYKAPAPVVPAWSCNGCFGGV
jgi:hypothetical protein